MNDREARKFIASAVGESGGAWADFGAGTGTFTRALRSLLRPGSRIYAIDSDPAAVAVLRKLGEGVVAVEADFTRPFTLPEPSPLDGMLFANALHFLPDPGEVLTPLVALLKPGGRVLIVEYDRRASSPWVPYPIASTRWPLLAESSGLERPQVTARRRSAYSGELYVVSLTRAAVARPSGPNRPEGKPR